MKRSSGFTFIELLVVLVIVSLTLALSAFAVGSYLERTAARRAAELFGQDLLVARSLASRSRQRVVVDFDETGRKYLIRVEAGDTLVSRSFDENAEIRLASLDLHLSGDTLAFSSRGVADLSGAGGPLGQATFVAGRVSYVVSFNSLGSSRMVRP